MNTEFEDKQVIPVSETDNKSELPQHVVDAVAVETDNESTKVEETIEEVRPIVKDWPSFPFTTLNMPAGYMLKPNGQGKKLEIVRYNHKTESLVMVTRSAIFPVAILEHAHGSSMVRPQQIMLMHYCEKTNTWNELNETFNRSKLVDATQVRTLADLGVSVGSSTANELAAFFQIFLETNKLEVRKRVDTLGWVEDASGKRNFVPYTEKYMYQANTAKKASRDYLSLRDTKGERLKALQVISRLSASPVFLTMLAGMFASPVIELLRERYRDNIGIDLSGATSTGKTTIQSIAFNLVYGYSEPFIKQWADATSNGFWASIAAANNIPLILDDSQHMGKHQADLPHALLNGRQGEKGTINRATNEIVAREQKEYSGVIFFNGEMPIISKSMNGSSRGLNGRAIMIRGEAAFPSSFTGKEVNDLREASGQNCGHFAREWIDYLAGLDTDTLIRQIERRVKFFKSIENDNVFERLRSKAAILLWALNKANKLLGLEIRASSIIPLLTKHMRSAASQADVIIEILKEVATHVSQNHGDYETFHPYANTGNRDGLFIPSENTFLVKKGCIQRIIGDRYTVRDFIIELHNRGIISKKESVSKNYKNKEGGRTQCSGYEFFKNKVEDIVGYFISAEQTPVQRLYPTNLVVHSEEELEQEKKLHAKRGGQLVIIHMHDDKRKSGRKSM